jgi:hypothetical protein
MNKWWWLRKRQKIFGIHTMFGISFLAEKLEISQRALFNEVGYVY